MRRRETLLLLTGIVIAWSLGARAQQPRKVPRIGLLSVGSPSTYVARNEAFRQGLHGSGYVEGESIAIDYRYAEGRFERLPELAAELVARKVDVIVAQSGPETEAAKRATSSIPIVFALHGDAVGSGHVASLARPGGNITGGSAFSPEMASKRLELLKEAFPHIARVAVLWNATNPVKAVDWREVQRAAVALDITLQSAEVRGPDDFASAFAVIAAQRPDALLTLADPLLLTARSSIAAFAAKERLPSVDATREYFEAGGLMLYAPDVLDSYRRAGVYAAKILKGASPADLPVQQPTKFTLVINLRTAKVLGLTIPSSLLARADEVIE